MLRPSAIRQVVCLEDLIGGSWCDPGVDVPQGWFGRKEQVGRGDSPDLKEPVGAA